MFIVSLRPLPQSKYLLSAVLIICCPAQPCPRRLSGATRCRMANFSCGLDDGFPGTYAARAMRRTLNPLHLCQPEPNPLLRTTPTPATVYSLTTCLIARSYQQRSWASLSRPTTLRLPSSGQDERVTHLLPALLSSRLLRPAVRCSRCLQRHRRTADLSRAVAERSWAESIV